MKTLILQIVVACLLIVGTLLFIYLQHNKIVNLTAELTTAHETVDRQAKTIDRLSAQKTIDENIVTRLLNGMNELRAVADAQTKAITELEKTDPDAKAFLATPIPDGLKRVLGNGQNR